MAAYRNGKVWDRYKLRIGEDWAVFSFFTAMNYLSHRSVYLRGALLITCAALTALLRAKVLMGYLPPWAPDAISVVSETLIAWRLWIDQSLSRRKSDDEADSASGGEGQP